MVQQTVKLMNPTGLHLRPAGVFCDTAYQFPCKITFAHGISIGSAKSILSVLGACIKCGDEITIMCDGPKEDEALRAMVEAVNSGLGEE